MNGSVVDALFVALLVLVPALLLLVVDRLCRHRHTRGQQNRYGEPMREPQAGCGSHPVRCGHVPAGRVHRRPAAPVDHPKTPDYVVASGTLTSHGSPAAESRAAA